MDYEPYDSSGTDDDLPPPHQNRIPRGHAAGNGRTLVISSGTYTRMYGETDMEAQIHLLEKEAYSSVLRAFKAQSDAITWEKESLITELRKELRLSNDEHRELLGRAQADDVIQRIREWRQAGGHQIGMRSSGKPVHDPVPSPSVSASRKKQKISQPVQAQPFGEPTPSLHPKGVAASNQPSSAKKGPTSGAKGKKNKSNQMFPGATAMKMQYRSSGQAGRPKYANQSSGALTVAPSDAHPLIGRKVRTRWPDDDNFYEAVITDYNPAEGRHALVYDIGTENETWEWVNLAEFSSKDIQWEDEDPRNTHQVGHSNSGHAINRSVGHNSSPGRARVRGMTKGPSRKDFPSSQNGIGRKGPDDIQLLHTDTLVKEVERIVDASHPDTLEIEKAKKVLKEHEQALTEALAKLADISDGETDEGAHLLHGQSMERER